MIGPESSVSVHVLLSHRYSFLADPQGELTLPLSSCISVSCQCGIFIGNGNSYRIGSISRIISSHTVIVTQI